MVVVAGLGVGGDIGEAPITDAAVTSDGVFRFSCRRYETHGPALFEHLWVTFAIAMWNEREQRLLLDRSRVGKEPLCYHFKVRQVWLTALDVRNVPLVISLDFGNA